MRHFRLNGPDGNGAKKFSNRSCRNHGDGWSFRSVQERDGKAALGWEKGTACISGHSKRVRGCQTETNGRMRDVDDESFD